MHLRLSFAVLLLSAAVASAQPGLPPTGGPIEKSAAFGLLANKAVQEDLKLDDAQKKKLAELPDDIRGRHKDELALFQGRAKDSAEALDKVKKSVAKDLADAEAKLLSADQRARLRQVEVQALALQAFADPDVAAALKLTDKQKADVDKAEQELNDAFMKFQEELAQEVGGDREKFLAELTKKRGALAAKAVAKVVDGLDEAQKAEWKKLAGEPAAMLPLPFGGPQRPMGGIPLAMILSSARAATTLRVLEAPGLAKELKLSDDAADKVKAISADLQKTHGENATKAFRDQGQARFTLGRLEEGMSRDARDRATGILKPEQAKRLRQLERQREGLFVFQDLEVLKAIKLTPEQAEAVQEAAKPLLRAGPGGGGGDFAERSVKAAAAVTAKFDDAQKKAWAELFGDPFDLGKLKDLPAPPMPRMFGGAGGPSLSPSDVWARQGVELGNKGDYAAALEAYDEAIRLGPKQSQGYNNKAYLLATCAEEKFRDGKKAVELAKKAVELTGPNDPNRANNLDTLACAYAEAGDFDNAVKTMTEALEKAPPFARDEFEMKMKLFKDKKAYHDQPKK
jgi:tetratricopeptide (TPR) repeat protein